MVKLKEKEFTLGQMVKFMMVNGNKVLNMVMEYGEDY